MTIAKNNNSCFSTLEGTLITLLCGQTAVNNCVDLRKNIKAKNAYYYM